MQVNVDGTFLVTRTMSMAMKCQETRPIRGVGRGTTRGSIVILGSGSSFVATPAMVQYTAAKHAVMGVAKNAGMSSVFLECKTSRWCHKIPGVLTESGCSS